MIHYDGNWNFNILISFLQNEFETQFLLQNEFPSLVEHFCLLQSKLFTYDYGFRYLSMLQHHVAIDSTQKFRKYICSSLLVFFVYFFLQFFVRQEYCFHKNQRWKRKESKKSVCVCVCVTSFDSNKQKMDSSLPSENFSINCYTLNSSKQKAEKSTNFTL